MATSGTVGTTVFNTRKVIDHAIRRCEKVPQQVGQEDLQVALDLLFMELSALANRGIPLWTIEPLLLPLYERIPSVQTPLGAVDVFNVNLRTGTRLSGTNTASQGTPDNAFDGDLSTACSQVAAAGYIQTQFTSAMAVPIFGILPNATGTWDVTIQYSDDGVTWTDIFTESTLAVVAGQWYWRDVEGVDTHLFYRLQANGTTVLDITELVWQNTPREIPCYKLNRDNYSNLPNKTRTGRPTQFWFNKTITRPVITLWPTPEAQYTFAQLTGYYHRQIQDVGTLQQQIECPQRWYLAVVLQLAKHLCKELKGVSPEIKAEIQADAAYELKRAWDGESDGADSQFTVNISPYTR